MRLPTAIVAGAIVAILALTASADSATSPPVVTTGNGFEVNTTSAQVNGVVNPQGQATNYTFQYGTTNGYGLQTPLTGAGGGTSDIAVHETLGDLTPNATYHYRLVAKSSAGTTNGADHTFSLAPSASQVAFMGRMGFVSPGHVIGVEAGCFGGATTCTGHVTMTPVGTGTVIGETDFTIPAHSGGFQNLKITPYGASLLTHNGVWRLLQVDVHITTSAGATIAERMSLARWVWH
jgi:hypothetical protein